ncbi:MAG: sensor histidine kinase [Chloroflexota bacterium]
MTRVADDASSQAALDVVFSALGTARALAQEHVAALFKLYEQIREAHREHLSRLRDVENQLQTVTHQVGVLRTAPLESLNSRQVLDLVDLEDLIPPLRQQQEWLAERLVQEASAARKIQAVARHAELTAGYLAGDLSEGGGVTDVTALAEVQMLQTHEDERRRLARDVHDGPAQVLANAVFGLEWCKRMLDRNPSQLGAELENIEHELRSGLDDVRQFIYDLSPVSFTELGLAVTLRRYLQRFSDRTHIAANLSIDPELERVNTQVEMGVFRIIQEALQNVRKHSQASTVDVSVARENGALTVVIADDGIGFDQSMSRHSGTHFGMVSMSERARLLRGELVIDSKVGAGTRVSLSVTVNELARDL